MVCSRLYSAWAQEEEICGCFIRTSEGSVRRICSGGEITRRKLILLLLASLVLAVGVSAYRRSSPQSSEPQKVSMDGYGWTTFGPPVRPTRPFKITNPSLWTNAMQSPSSSLRSFITSGESVTRFLFPTLDAPSPFGVISLRFNRGTPLG